MTGKLKKVTYVALIAILIGWVIFRFAAVASENARNVFNASRVAMDVGAPVTVVEMRRRDAALYEPLAVKNNRAYVSGERAAKLRSGQKISYDGTLVIFGDVNAGAELEAAGHILVLGALRGVAHAGCKGDKHAVIYANQLSSVQLRIADLIARAPDGENTKRNIPEIARIMDNYLVIEEV